MQYKKPQLVFSDRLPHPRAIAAPESRDPATLLIYDRILLSRVPGFGAWVRKFPAAYGVKAGEELKELANYAKHMEKILALADRFPPKDLVLVAVGGGSVGDFGGFTASILKRGVRLVQIPTTWLSAIDSAHGGKTALNVGGVKNQIGTYYSAKRIFLVRSILLSQGSRQANDAFGELAKIALIAGGEHWKALLGSPSSAPGREGRLIWEFLPRAIEAKYRIVSKDPFETKRIRQVLNLGHTVGHVLEAHYKLPHGGAVAQGLLFCLEWSRRRGHLGARPYAEIRALLEETFRFSPLTAFKGFRPIPERAFADLLRSDKKRHSASEITFIFLRGFGKTSLVDVPIAEIVGEARAQGWVKE